MRTRPAQLLMKFAWQLMAASAAVTVISGVVYVCASQVQFWKLTLPMPVASSRTAVPLMTVQPAPLQVAQRDVELAVTVPEVGVKMPLR
jgi:hypothetical protein